MTRTFEQWAESEGLDMSVDWKGKLTSPVTAGALRGWEAAQSAGQEAVAMTDAEILAAPVNGGERDEDGVGLREAAEMAVEAFGLLGGLIDEIRTKGNYSQETTIRFLEEAQMCLYRLHNILGDVESE